MTHSIGLTPELVDYIVRHNAPEHPVMQICREETMSHYRNDAWFQVSQEQMAFMQLVLKLSCARRVLEVGTFTGYSALGFALTALEISSHEAHVVTIDRNCATNVNARRYFAMASLGNCIELVEGDASEELPKIAEQHASYFDLCFIDADKANTQYYINQCALATRRGGIILVDNVLWNGKVLQPELVDADTEGLRQTAAKAINDHRFDCTMCSVGDGLLFLIKK